jgi:hypothetical protein
MEKLESECPTPEQTKETLEAYRTGGDALIELIRKRVQRKEKRRSSMPGLDTEKYSDWVTVSSHWQTIRNNSRYLRAILELSRISDQILSYLERRALSNRPGR